MKKRPNNFARASALQITLSAALIAISAVFLAPSFEAAPAASGLSAAIAPDLAGARDLASGTWTITGSLHEPRYFHTATLLPNGQVLVAGGFIPNGGNPPIYRSSAELYNPASGSWTLTGSLHDAREGHAATLLPNGKVLVAGGFGGGGVIPPQVGAELYDPASGSWTATGSLNSRRYYHTATSLPSGKVLVAGGVGSIGTPASAELYDPASASWTATGSLNSGRYYHTATLLPNGKVLVAGGNLTNVGISNRAELYDPASGSWTITGSLNTARTIHTATLLPNGQVLVAGGTIGGGNNLSSAELYDPASGSWTATGSLNTARYDHTTTLLPNGQVLAAGGYATPSAELHDPASGSWTATGSLNDEHTGPTATLLPNGKVLVVGGGITELYTQPELCCVCHRRMTTPCLPCDSLEYQRHLDHGDTFGPCPVEANSPAAEDGALSD